MRSVQGVCGNVRGWLACRSVRECVGVCSSHQLRHGEVLCDLKKKITEGDLVCVSAL